MTIRSPKHNSQGFTLVEIIASLIVVGVILGIASPSFLSLNKPLRNGSLQFKSQLALIRSKAISSSQAYRIRPKFPNRSDYVSNIPNQFIVEFAANCRIATLGGANGWERASQLDLDLPANVGITDAEESTFGSVTFTGTNDLNWNVCFDNRGIVDAGSRTKLIVKDFQGTNKAEIAAFDISTVGGVDMLTYTKKPIVPFPSYPTGTDINDVQTPPNPVF